MQPSLQGFHCKASQVSLPFLPQTADVLISVRDMLIRPANQQFGNSAHEAKLDT